MDHSVVRCCCLFWEHNWAAIEILCQVAMLVMGGKATAVFSSCFNVYYKEQ